MGGEVRICDFVCHCGSNIAGFVNPAEAAEYASTLPDVAFIRKNLDTCSESGTSEITAAIRGNRLNRVVVAACTPRTRKRAFRAACREAGLNPSCPLGSAATEMLVGHNREAPIRHARMLASILSVLLACRERVIPAVHADGMLTSGRCQKNPGNPGVRLSLRNRLLLECSRILRRRDFLRLLRGSNSAIGCAWPRTPS